MPIQKVLPRKQVVHGRVRWRVIVPKCLVPDKSRRTKFFASKTEADRYANTLEIDRISERDGWHHLDPNHKTEIYSAIRRLGGPEELRAAVEFYVKHKPPASRTIKQIAGDYLDSIALAGKSAIYQTTLKCSLDRFCLTFGDRRAEEVPAQDIEKWLHSQGGDRGKWKPETKRWHHKNLTTLFRFAELHRYIMANPMRVVKKPEADHRPPSIFTPDQCARIMRWLHENDRGLIRYVALQLFGGLRASEAARLCGDDLGGDYIEVSAKRAKTRKRRLITVNETLRAWISVAKKEEHTFSELKYRLRALAIGAKVKWERNALRHSFVSYHYALHGASATAREAGHSEQILFAHYRETTPKPAAQIFFSILPR